MTAQHFLDLNAPVLGHQHAAMIYAHPFSPGIMLPPSNTAKYKWQLMRTK